MSKSSGKGRSTGTIPPFILAAACLQERAISRNGFRLASVSAWRAQAMHSSAYFRYFVGCRHIEHPPISGGSAHHRRPTPLYVGDAAYLICVG